MFRKKITVPPPAPPVWVQEGMENKLQPIKAETKPQESGEFDQVMSVFSGINQKLEILIENQTKIYELIQDRTLTLRDQNSRIRELIMTEIVDVSKFNLGDVKV